MHDHNDEALQIKEIIIDVVRTPKRNEEDDDGAMRALVPADPSTGRRGDSGGGSR
jgi:hypothetical protein